jgi:hypothetical protein
MVTDVLIALIPKASGGLRPIDIFPSFIRLWMRLRSDDIREWERLHARTFLFAGQRKGANVALWLQAGMLEQAALSKAVSAATLIDLVKAFERVSHSILAREAV